MIANSKLVLHAGGAMVPYADVLAVPTPTATRTHYPISHGVLLDNVIDGLRYYGYEVSRDLHALTANGDQYFGVLDLKNTTTESFGMTLGIRNCHVKRFSAGLCLGSRVFVCDNLAFMAEIRIQRKHTRFIVRDLPIFINNIISNLAVAHESMVTRYDAYKRTALTTDRARSLMVEAVKRGVIGCTALPAVLGAWESMPHEEFRDPSVWRLFNAVTEAAKTWSPTRLLKGTKALHQLCDLEVGMAT